jgi:peroxiredoxin
MKIKIINYSVLMGSLLLFMNFSKPIPPEDGYTVSGHITGLPDGELYLAHGSFSTMKADTVLAKNGDFTFRGTTTEPCFGMLFTHDYRVKVDLFVDNSKISVQGNIDSMYDVQVQGSPVVNEFAAYNQSLLDTRKPVQVIFEKLLDADKRKDTAAVTQYQASFNAARDEQSKKAQAIQINFIQKHPGSYASAWELIHYINGKTLQESKNLFTQLNENVRESVQGKEIADRIATLDRIEVGSIAPGFEQQSVDNRTISLSSYKGKYVLLEFWASWCAPCRAESPNLKKEYQQFKDKGFDVLSVSLDNDAGRWKDAIQKDGIPWTQVCDLKGWKNEAGVLYGINAVPANFLIDPDGKIVARDLRGEALGKYLQTLFH